jgi:hypothetical protein
MEFFLVPKEVGGYNHPCGDGVPKKDLRDRPSDLSGIRLYYNEN